MIDNLLESTRSLTYHLCGCDYIISYKNNFLNQYKKFVIEGLRIFSLMYNGNYNIAISVAAFLKLLETILFNKTICNFIKINCKSNRSAIYRVGQNLVTDHAG